MRPPLGDLCQLELGVYVRRRCAELAQGSCASCGRRICGLHLRVAPSPVCYLCAQQQQQQQQQQPPRPDPVRQRTYEDAVYVAPHVFDHWDTPRTAGTVAAAEAWRGGGGRSGGGGASERFDDPSRFGPEDYAAFDRAGRHDQRLGHGSYDS